MKTLRSGLAAVVLLSAAINALGCGGTLYALQVNSAASKVAQAKELGADKLAPYEYYYASEHLRQAMSEASEGDYADAKDFADIAEEYADKAIKLSKEAHRGAGR
jgi:uncharacterized protein DUF4398